MSTPSPGGHRDSADTVDFDAILTGKDDEIAALKDKWLRAVADHENYKKRVKRDIDDAVTRKTQALLNSFLPTIDNLDRALEIAEPVVGQVPKEVAGNVEQVVKGMRMVRDEFLAIPALQVRTDKPKKMPRIRAKVAT